MMAAGMLSKGRSHPLERWGFFWLCFGQLGFFLSLLGPRVTPRPVSDVVMIGTVASFMFVSVIGTLLILGGRRRGAREVMARAGRLCPRCRYPLPAAEQMGVCPECGDPYTHEDNLIAWRARYPWLRL
jgi:hypothetical protein